MSTYVPIQAITLSASATSIEFTGIPQTFTDLVLVSAGGMVSGGMNDNQITFNGDTGTNYSRTWLLGNGTSALSGRSSNQNFITTPYWGSGTMNSIIHIMSYSNTTTNKTVLARNNNGSDSAAAYVFLWRNTTAINRITITRAASIDFASGSTFTLYGVGSGSPKAFGGDRVVTDGTYWYHAFTSSGRFEPVQALNADVLVIAGGGGGGSGNNSGGGGAGGLLAFTSQSLTAQNYTITVGAGGATGNPNGVVGNDSQFGSLTLVKGGGRGAADTTAGGTGGSGGGNGFNNTGTAGQPTTGQGFAGGPGQGNVAPDYFGGGGGGAGEAGNTDAIGQGGDGVSTYSSWGVATSTGQDISGTRWFAGGGGGSGQSNSVNRVGGDGGGGRGAGTSGAAQAGTANTGGGGGGSGNSAGNTGAAGGSGIVIVRYAV